MQEARFGIIEEFGCSKVTANAGINVLLSPSPPIIFSVLSLIMYSRKSSLLDDRPNSSFYIRLISKTRVHILSAKKARRVSRKCLAHTQAVRFETHGTGLVRYLYYTTHHNSKSNHRTLPTRRDHLFLAQMEGHTCKYIRCDKGNFGGMEISRVVYNSEH